MYTILNGYTMKHKDSVLRLKTELQAAHRGYFTWKDVRSLVEVFPEFEEMYFQYNGTTVSELKVMMCEDGYKLRYKAYIDMFSKFVGEYLYTYEKSLYNKIMFE
jgi:hypothetical protein